MTTADRTPRPVKHRAPRLAWFLISALATLFSSLGAGVALANGGGHHHRHGADVTFTK